MAVPYFEVTTEKPVQPVDDPYGLNAVIVFGTFSVPLADMYPEITHLEEPTVGIPEPEEEKFCILGSTSGTEFTIWLLPTISI